MNIINQSRTTVLAERARVADTFWARLIGLLNRSNLANGEALVIPGCKAIHMVGMRFAIDAVFVDTDNRVVATLSHFKPFRVSPFFARAQYVIELPAGTVETTHTAVGDTIALTNQ